LFLKASGKGRPGKATGGSGKATGGSGLRLMTGSSGKAKGGSGRRLMNRSFAGSVPPDHPFGPTFQTESASIFLHHHYFTAPMCVALLEIYHSTYYYRNHERSSNPTSSFTHSQTRKT